MRAASPSSSPPKGTMTSTQVTHARSPGDRYPDVLAGHGPGAGIGENVLPGPLDFLPSVEPMPAGMDAAGGVVLEPDRGHDGQVARLQGPIKSEVGGGNGCRIGGHPRTIYRKNHDRRHRDRRAGRALSRHASLRGPRGAESRSARARARTRHPRRGVLEAGVQVPPPPVRRVERGREGPDAGILRARHREGVLRRLRSGQGQLPHLPADLSRPLRRQREEGGGTPEAFAGHGASRPRLRGRGERADARGPVERTGPWNSTFTTSSCAACWPSPSRSCARIACSAARTCRIGSSSATSSTAIPTRSSATSGLAEEFHIPVTQVTNFLAFARREFRRIVLEKLREITANDREFREEARSLLGVSP